MRMNEVYNTIDSNPVSEVEQIPTEVQIQKMKAQYQKRTRNEKYMNFFILAVGIFGFTYVFFLQDDFHSKDSLLMDEALNITATKLPTKEGKKLTDKNQMSINGIFEANEKIRFTLDSYNDEVVYTLRYGNGYGQVLKGEVTEYVYPNAGIFKVTLEARYKSEKVIMHNEYISIDDAITVADGAFLEQI